MNTFSQNRQVKLIKPQNEFYKQINQNINTTTKFIKPKYLRLTEEYYEKLGGLSTERQTETKVHFDEYYYEGETYNSEEYERYTNGEDSPSYMMYLNAKEFKGEFMREILKIYFELNIYKKHEMQVHPESEQFTLYYTNLF
jgi:hypothetical protein